MRLKLYVIAALSLLPSMSLAATSWPMPLNQTLCVTAQTSSDRVLYIDTRKFHYKCDGYESDLLRTAFDRYEALIFNTAAYSIPDGATHRRVARIDGAIKRLTVSVASFDQSLNANTDESYVLAIEAPETRVQATTVFGAIRALETFAQLVDRIDHVDRLRPLAGDKNGDDWLEDFVAVDEGDVDGEDVDLDDDFGGSDLDKHRHKKKKHHHYKHRRPRRPKALYIVNETVIYDSPRFRHRGLLIDTARHFLPVRVLLDHLDAMAASKMNVLHWHIVDDQSFPYESEALPLLAIEGAFSPERVYTRRDVKDIVAYARERGIRVVPEFDTPGHTLSWGAGYPPLLTDCCDEDGEPTGEKGPMNPARKETYTFLWTLFREVAKLFPDAYMHLGGDEVPFDCWKSNPEIRKWMDAKGMDNDFARLEEYFETKVLELAAAAGKSYIVWQEIFDNGIRVKEDTVIQVWKWWADSADPARNSSTAGDGPATTSGREAEPVRQAQPASQAGQEVQPEMRGGAFSLPTALSARAGRRADLSGGQRPRPRNDAPQTTLQPSASTASQRRRALLEVHARADAGVGGHGADCRVEHGCPAVGVDADAYLAELDRVTSNGHRALLSAPWYLDHGGYYGEDWLNYYNVEPLGFKGSPEQHSLVMGGEACMWGEYVDATNSIARTWPRAAAVAERLWSPADVRDADDARARLKQHRCRLMSRGISAQPLGPGFCPGEEV